MDWSEKFSIGIPEIDEQHRTVVECISRLERAGDQEQRDLAVYFAMEQLDNYVRVHFASEEVLMRLLRFPEFDAHVKEHREFSEKLAILKRNQLAQDIHLQIGKFLRDWWTDHVMRVDRRYADYMLTTPLAQMLKPGAQPAAKK